MVDHVGVQVISAARPEWIFPFTGLQPAQFRRLVRLVAELAVTRSLTAGRAGSGLSTSPIGCCWSRRTGART
jgi:hypothetical protein